MEQAGEQAWGLPRDCREGCRSRLIVTAGALEFARTLMGAWVRQAFDFCCFGGKGGDLSVNNVHKKIIKGDR